jgi:hypothetical protein
MYEQRRYEELNGGQRGSPLGTNLVDEILLYMDTTRFFQKWNSSFSNTTKSIQVMLKNIHRIQYTKNKKPKLQKSSITGS